MESFLFPSAMSSNSSSLSEEPSCLYSTTTTDNRVSSSAVLIHGDLEEDSKDKCSLLPTSLPRPTLLSQQNSCKIKKKRSLPGNPDPAAEVIALSPGTLLATNRFVCEICSKGFQRDQNLQLHRRGHNLPWKLKKRSSAGKDQVARKRVYICPEPACVHHHPSRALGDLTGIKKHYCRKHGEKKWKCAKCSKVYAVQSDWKAHMKTCGTREYRCDCGTLFSRKDSFITHRAFCDALAEESARLIQANQQEGAQVATANSTINHHTHNLITSHSNSPSDLFPFPPQAPGQYTFPLTQKIHAQNPSFPNNFLAPPPPPSHHLSATALLQKAVTLGATTSTRPTASSFMDHMAHLDYCLGFGQGNYSDPLMKKSSDGEITRDFLGLQGEDRHNNTDHVVSEGSMKPHSWIQNLGFLADHPAISNVATASSRMWG